MNKNYKIFNARIINEGEGFLGALWVKDGKIEKIIPNNDPLVWEADASYELIDAGGNLLIPGVIDDQVHFRDPGLTRKGDLFTESRAAVAGGVCSFMEMPNTIPQALTQEILEDKYKHAAEVSLANYSFYMGASNENIEEILKTDPANVCGLKVFMGASTGDMLVDNPQTLENIFSKAKLLVAVHCEDEETIRINTKVYHEKYGEDMPLKYHPEIRSREVCLKSSTLAVELAKKHNTRLHVLHLSTADEMVLFENSLPLAEKRITAEVCVHHLWFDEGDYERLGTKIKWNPAIKKKEDKEELFQALLDDKLDVIATDHAPHTSDEKNNKYFQAPSGGPLVQHSLVAMLEFYHQKKITLEKIVEKMCHAPAICFQVDKRGFLREGYWADFVLIDLQQPWTVNKGNIFYKCGWSPFEGQVFNSKITHTFVNGIPVYENGMFDESKMGKRLKFNR
jgi:dihydroorotase